MPYRENVCTIFRTNSKLDLRPANIEPSQFGFTKGASCTDVLFTLRQMSEKATEYNNDINILFINQEKTFDKINRNILWETLENCNVKGQLLDNFRALCQNCLSVVRATERLTDHLKH
jgi:hypothetical protein